MTIPQRIENLRKAMANSNLDAYIITGSDPHGSEIPAKRWQTRKWISGFTGSAGTVVVTAQEAGLWTDCRYWIQAERELAASGISLFRSGGQGVPQPHEWLIQNLDSGSVLGFDGRTISYQTAREWEWAFEEAEIRISASLNLLDKLWEDRPQAPMEPIIELNALHCGESRSTRLRRLRKHLRETGADTWIASAMDTAAWLLTLRGQDLPYTPVVMGYMIVNTETAVWYTNTSRLTPKLIASLREDGIEAAPYEDFIQAVITLPNDSRILIDPEQINYSVMTKLPQKAKKRIMPDPVYKMKAIKNAVELAHLRHAMEKDGASLVKFFVDIERRLRCQEAINEFQAAEYLRRQRAGFPGFLGNSFSTIAAMGANGAICHYETTPDSQNLLNSTNSLFLLDSGGQWEEGTTDITRTVKFGRPSLEEIRDYTKVLKAHIALSRLRFPSGACGYQLDVIPRMGLWQDGMDYGHGTGHGVGFRLGVHEGPQVISPKPVNVKLEPGMVITNEPGIYRKGRYGIRIENIMVCREDEKNEFGDFLSFETLSLAPYHRALIDLALLDAEDIRWIDDYHATVRKRLSPLLTTDESRWLQAATEKLA